MLYAALCTIGAVGHALFYWATHDAGAAVLAGLISSSRSSPSATASAALIGTITAEVKPLTHLRATGTGPARGYPGKGHRRPQAGLDRRRRSWSCSGGSARARACPARSCSAAGAGDLEALPRARRPPEVAPVEATTTAQRAVKLRRVAVRSARTLGDGWRACHHCAGESVRRRGQLFAAAQGGDDAALGDLLARLPGPGVAVRACGCATDPE